MIQRRTFLKSACITCLGGGMAAALASGCKGLHYVNSSLVGGKLVVPRTEFSYLKKKELQYRKWVVVKHPEIAFPIGVYRLDEDQFFASYLQCTHQGCEVQPEGDFLQCPCHGSEFDKQGKLRQGPAETDLKTFAIQTDPQNLYILL